MNGTDESVDKHILIVDDEDFIRRLLFRYLTRKSYSITLTKNAAEAQKAVQRQSFFAAFIDIVLPDSNGLRLVESFRAVQPDMIPLMITGHPTMQTALEALRLGAFDYLIKPFKLNQIDGILEKAQNERTVRRENHRLREMVAAAQSETERYRSILDRVQREDREDGGVTGGKTTGGDVYRMQSLRSKEVSLREKLETLVLLQEQGIISESECVTRHRELVRLLGASYEESAESEPA